MMGWLEEGIGRGGWWARTVGVEWESEAAGRVGGLRVRLQAKPTRWRGKGWRGDGGGQGWLG